MKRRLRPTLLLAFSVGVCPPLGAQTASDEVMRADEAWRQARVNGDKTAYASLLADDFTWTFISGRVVNKAQSVGNLRAAPDPETSRDIRVYENAAVVVGTASLTIGGRPVTERFLRVWIRRDGRWQAVLFQATEIAQ